MANSEKKLLNPVIGGKYRLLQKTPHPQLVYENKVYRHLNFLEYSIGIPQVHHFGLEKGEYYCLVMDLLGLSLEDLFNFCGRQFTIRTVVMLADQLLTRIKQLHESDFLHRDVKPDNFLMGMQPSQANTVFIIDYGLAKKYKDSHQKHIAEKNRKQLIGTARYASLNSHLGLEQSRRDDLESLGYMLIYFLKGSLPWQGIKIVSKNEKYAKIYEKKSAVSVEELCQECPHQFADYLNYTRNLGFEETPNYSYLSGLFTDLFLSLPEQAKMTLTGQSMQELHPKYNNLTYKYWLSIICYLTATDLCIEIYKTLLQLLYCLYLFPLIEAALWKIIILALCL